MQDKTLIIGLVALILIAFMSIWFYIFVYDPQHAKIRHFCYDQTNLLWLNVKNENETTGEAYFDFDDEYRKCLVDHKVNP